MDSDPPGPEEIMIYKSVVASMMIGQFLATFLCGIATLQTLLYFISSRKDHWAHKISILLLWILVVLQLIFIFHGTHRYAIEEGINNPQRAEFVWSLKLQIFMLTIIMSATKVLYTIRVWKLQKDRHKWIIILLTILLVVEYGLGTYFAYEVTLFAQLRELLGVSARFKYSVFFAMSFNCLTDIAVATALIYTLVKSRPNLGWTSSSSTMLAAYVLNTGAITGLFSLIALIGFATGVKNPLFIISEMVLPQLYVNCFLSMINASFYFQTRSSLDISITYRRPSSYLLNLPRMGQGSDPENLPGRKSYSMDSMANGQDYDYSNVTLVKSAGTINEIGLPLFERDDFTRPEVPVKKKPLEVQVQTSKVEYTVDRMMLQGTGTRNGFVETSRSRR